MKVGIVGARIAGSYAALLLSGQGHEVFLFDESIERNKPCGGGITGKVLRRMKWFNEHPLPHAEIKVIQLIGYDGYTSNLPLASPVHIYSRLSLDTFLRRWATESGAHFRPERVRKIARGTDAWAVETSAGATEFDYLIGADGANSYVRARLTRPLASDDLSLAVGYYLPGTQHPGTLLIKFQELGFQGYLWSFPCVDYSSVGIGRLLPGVRAADLRKRVEAFIAEHYSGIGTEGRFYAALIPSLRRKSLMQQRVCGRDWALLGDAAGFADPITSEGIYYALRSAELLAESFQQGDPRSYENAWRRDFGFELESSAVWRDRFYGGMVLSHTFIRRALQTVRHSGAVRALLDDLICGSIGYSSLLRNLVLRAPSILLQVFRNRAFLRATRNPF